MICLYKDTRLVEVAIFAYEIVGGKSNYPLVVYAFFLLYKPLYFKVSVLGVTVIKKKTRGFFSVSPGSVGQNKEGGGSALPVR